MSYIQKNNPFPVTGCGRRRAGGMGSGFKKTAPGKSGTPKAHSYCARSSGIKKCKNPPCPNTLSRKKWKCKGKRSVC